MPILQSIMFTWGTDKNPPDKSHPPDKTHPDKSPPNMRQNPPQNKIGKS